MSNPLIRYFTAAAVVAAIIGVSPAAHAQTGFQPSKPIWGGIYMGIQGGYGWGKTDVTEDPNNALAYNGAGNAWSYDTEGMLGGVHVGLDWESQNLILGLETSAGYLAIEGDAADPGSGGLDTIALAGSGYYVDITGRIGFGAENTLYYMKGGLALADLGLEVEDTCTGGACSAASISAVNDDVQSGWTMGVGIAYAFTHDVSMRIEYGYYDFGEIDVTGSYGGNDYNWIQEVNYHTVTMGLSFMF